MESYTRLCVWLVGVLFPLCGIAQTAINGTVTDVSGEPVIGATILQQGTSNGTITDFDGNFNLQVPEGAMLEISYVGYASQTLAAAAGMKVVLKEDTEVLEEVVVVGYGSRRKVI